MRILLCEFVTGGGMPAEEPIPASFAREGELMLRALVDGLLEIPGTAVTVTRDGRLSPLPPPVRSITVDDPQRAWVLWEEEARSADAVWPVAPETGGALERLSRLVVNAGSRLLNSRPEAVAVAARKSATADALIAAGIPAVPAWPVDGLDDPPGRGPWVVKPDDGAGCLDTGLLRDRSDWLRWRAGADRSGFVVQPFVEGVPASLSLLCRDGEATVLTVNRLFIKLRGSRFVYRGGVVGGGAATPAMTELARAVAAALPGLFGYVGIDLVDTDRGPRVLEVNPRPTTSMVGLRRATGINVAAAVLDLIDDRHPLPPTPARVVPVRIELEEEPCRMTG
ncbi:ATP-grasp domain-containing protein [Azospirillum sp. RWY-5-1]|uniref:ATP-grasp domain-containing protein n=1 Tax=Azospirillum oleiclasticum TaxID=2735135 RepID=A0ABX2TKL7_9PROT|nr:ATP-grasp domain-containing protein [Azospirillum oleiclasticum]NYZ14468.1 ATP-grasp domain-containing protein [Azospirillum oleiclasticum]NYZ23180.1 ATP-grasp domain-containing protein [Azospirillum oleiclasticum]